MHKAFRPLSIGIVCLMASAAVLARAGEKDITNKSGAPIHITLVSEDGNQQQDFDNIPTGASQHIAYKGVMAKSMTITLQYSKTSGGVAGMIPVPIPDTPAIKDKIISIEYNRLNRYRYFEVTDDGIELH